MAFGVDRGHRIWAWRLDTHGTDAQWRVAYSGDTYLFLVSLGLIYCKNSKFYRMVCQLSTLHKLPVGMVITCVRLTVWVCTPYIISSALCRYDTFQWWLALYAGRRWGLSTLLASRVNLHMEIRSEFEQVNSSRWQHLTHTGYLGHGNDMMIWRTSNWHTWTELISDLESDSNRVSIKGYIRPVILLSACVSTISE